MLGLNIYSYIEDGDVQFYRTQKALAKKMDILDWIPGSYAEEVVQGGESPLDIARRINYEDMAMTTVFANPQPLLVVHPGNPSATAGGEVDEEMHEEEEEHEEHEEEERECEFEEGGTGYTQESEAPARKKAMRIATPQSKLVPVLTVDDARDMYSRDATATFRERRKLKGKKLYGDYAEEETIAINSEDEDDIELANRLTSDAPSAFAGMVRVKPEVLTVEEANERIRREEEQRVRLERAAAEEPAMRNEVAELNALLLAQERQRTLVQPPPSADLISQVIQGMFAQGLMMAPPGAFPQLPLGTPPQAAPQTSFSFQHMVGPHVRPYAPVQQVDDPNLWRLQGSSRPLTPPPLRPPLVMAPHHQQDDPHMFGSSDPNTPTPAVQHSVALEAREFGSADPNPPVPALPGSSSPQTGEFGSTDPNPVAAQDSLPPHSSEGDTVMLESQGPQGPGDTSIPNPIHEPLHDEHAEVGLGQRPDKRHLQEQVAADLGGGVGGERGGPAQAVEPSTASRHDRGEVMH